jgi:hypothetical protein
VITAAVPGPSPEKTLLCEGGGTVPLKTTPGEFERFFNDVLGDDWAIDEWETDQPGNEITHLSQGDPFTIKSISVCWNTVGRTPTPTRWISASQISNGLSVERLLREWRRRKQIVTLSFDVPADQVAAVVAAVVAAGGTRI